MRFRPASAAASLGAVLLLVALPTRADDPDTGERAAPGDAHGQTEDHIHQVVIVTATPIEHDRDELAVPVERLGRQEVLERASATLGETLATLPGIATSGFTGGASRPVIRGQDAFRTGVLEDGLPTQDVSRESPDHAVPVNPLVVRAIEVVRGPAVLRYGGGASAGVVNAITHRVPDALPAESVTGEVFGVFDAVADRREGAVALDGGVGEVAWHLDGLAREAGNYSIPTGGRQKGTFAEAFSGSAGASYFFDKGRFGAAYGLVENEYGIPAEDENAAIDMRSHRVRFEGDWNQPVGGVYQVRVRGLYSDYRHEERVDGIVGQTFDNEQFDGRLELVHDGIVGFHGAVGVAGGHRALNAGGEAAAYLAPTTTAQGALYLFEERALAPGLVGELGLRLEGVAVEGTPGGASRRRERRFFPISGSAALVFAPSVPLSFGLTLAASQRAPSEVELFAMGPHEATGTFETGSLGLDEETSYAIELRAGFQNARMRVEAAGFFTFYRDYIFGQLTGATVDEEGDPVPPDDPGALDELFYRARDAFFAGVELSGEVDLFDALRGTLGIEGQFDYVRARFTSGPDRNVPRITPIRWGGALFYRSECLRGRIGFLRTEKQGDASAFESTTAGFTFLNASLTLRLEPLGGWIPVELGIAGHNLTDERGRNHVSFKADELLLPGRNVRGTVRVSF